MDQLNASQLLDAIYESAVDGIIIIDKKGIILSANPAVGQLFGYNRNELIGQSVNMLMPKQHKTAHDGYISNYLETGKAKIIGIGREVEGVKKDGSTFPFDLSVSQITVDNGEPFFAGTIHDISKQKEAQKQIEELNQVLEEKIEERTEQLAKVVNRLTQTNIALRNEIHERKLMEEMLRKSEAEAKLALERERELSDLKSRFITTASHEFRTPLSTIMSSAKLIGRYEQAEHHPKREKHIDRIVKVVNNLNVILDDLLSWSKLEEGKSAYAPQMVKISDLIQIVLEEAEVFSKANQQISYTHQGEQHEVFLDPLYLNNILLNLISNAVKYSDEGANIHINCIQYYNKIVIEVIDEGYGIPEQAQAHLLERFYRAENVHNIPGTGLGLSIVQKYLEAMNGKLSFDSTLGEGSTFRIEIQLT
jgi:two-component system sensor kinase FixL